MFGFTKLTILASIPAALITLVYTLFRVSTSHFCRRLSRVAGSNFARRNCNADTQPDDVRVYCLLDEAGKSLLKATITLSAPHRSEMLAQLRLSARAYHRILKLARTIADLAGSAEIRPPHLAEAIQYRPRRQF